MDLPPLEANEESVVRGRRTRLGGGQSSGNETDCKPLDLSSTDVEILPPKTERDGETYRRMIARAVNFLYNYRLSKPKEIVKFIGENFVLGRKSNHRIHSVFKQMLKKKEIEKIEGTESCYQLTANYRKAKLLRLSKLAKKWKKEREESIKKRRTSKKKRKKKGVKNKKLSPTGGNLKPRNIMSGKVKNEKQEEKKERKEETKTKKLIKKKNADDKKKKKNGEKKLRKKKP